MQGKTVQIRLACGLFAALLASANAARGNAPPDKAVPNGVVVETVSKGSAGEIAGIRAGDVVSSWSLTQASDEKTSGEAPKIESGFDLMEVEMEQAFRSRVSLRGTRNDVATTWAMPPGPWGLIVRPNLTGEYLSVYQEGKALADAKKTADAAARWKEARAKAEGAGEIKLAVWFQYVIARAFTTAKMWPEADAAYEEATQLAVANQQWLMAAQIQKTCGTVFQGRNDWEHAGQCFQKQLEFNEKIGPDRITTGMSLIDLGNLSVTRGDLDTAAKDYEQAQAIFRKMAPGSLAEADGLNDMGSVKLSRGQMAEAGEFFKKTLEIKEKLAPDSLTLASTLSNLGVVNLDRGRLDDAEGYLQRSLVIRQKLAPNSMAVAQSLGNLGTVALRKTDYEKAEKYYQDSLVMREELAPGGLEVAGCLMNLGTVAHARGDLAGAEALYQKSLPIQEKLQPGSHNLLGMLHNLGNVAEERGDLEAAEGYQRRALAISEKLSQGNVDSARIWNSIATIAAARADYDTANDYLERALKIVQEKEPESVDVATLLGQLGSVAYDRKDLAKAEGFYKQELERAQNRMPGRMEEALALSNLGILSTDRGQLDAAQSYQEKSLAILEQLAPGGLSVAQGLNALGRVALEKKDFETAEKETKEGLAIRERLAPGSTVEARSLHDLGMVYRGEGKSDLAREYLCRAVDAVEQQRAKLGGTHETGEAFSANFADYYEACLETLVDGGHAAEAFQILERERARSLLNMMAERDLLFTAELSPELARERNLTNADYDRVQSQLSGLSPGKDSEKIEKLLGQLRDLHQKQEEIAEKIRSASPRIASLQYPKALDVAGVQAKLDPGTVMLSYAVGSKKSFLFVVQPPAPPGGGTNGLSVFPLDVGEQLLRGKVEAFRNAIQSSDGDPASRDLQASALYELLVKPAESQLATGERLLILPDGPLDTLPFAALMRKESGAGKKARLHYLVEWKALHTVVSGTVYAEIKKSRSESSWTVPFEAFGDPKYLAASGESAAKLENVVARGMLTRGWNLGPLPFTRVEVESLAALEPQPNVKYLGEDATEERAKAAGKDIRYLHFAVHGLLDERFPLNSALALTIPEKPAEGQDNGLLQAWEVFEQMRINADLVVLSACDTALGKEMGGEGLVGLTRAFHYAGAHSVLASLWSVSDRSTVELMKGFYGYLKAGKSKDEALRLAQLDLIHSRGKNGAASAFAQPFHWAAFQLSGDWK